MEVKTKAVVLRCVPYADNRQVIDLFTEACGRVQFACRMAKTARGKLKRQLFQPLTLLNVAFDYRPKLSLQRMRDVSIYRPYTQIPYNMEKLGIAMFVAEFLTYATRNEQRNDALFNYIEQCLTWLDTDTGHFANFHLVFMMRIARFLGLMPNVDDYTPGCYFDLRNACFAAIRPLHNDYLQPQQAQHFLNLIRMDYKTMHLYKLTRDERNECAEVILQFYRLHVPGFPELKSLDVLKQLFV